MTNFPLNNPETIFGEVLVAQLTPTVQISNVYAQDPATKAELEIFEATGGSADNLNNMFRCQTGTSVGGYGVIRSAGTLRYRSGEGAECRITATFTTGIASSLQFAGLFSLTETVAFGYDGADFSIIHEYNGEAEIQTLQVTNTATSGAGNVTVTLDGDAVVIAVTNTTVQTNAEEIRAGLAADGTVGAKWRFEQVDDTCICISQSVGDKTGTFSFVDTGTTGMTMTITEVEAGAAKSSSNVAQASWNITTTPFTGFDPTKLNIYRMEYGYLGAAGILYEIYNPETGKFIPVHRIEWANNNTIPFLGNPDMKVGWTAASLGSSGTNLTVTGASALGAIQGAEVIQEPSKASFNTVASVGTTFTNILTIQNRIVYGNRFNLGELLPASLSVDNEHNKGLIIEVIKNATIGGTPNYQYFDENNSIAAIDTAGTTITNGDVIEAATVPANGDVEIDLEKLKDFLLPEETLTVAARTVSGTATNVTAAITWKEEK